MNSFESPTNLAEQTLKDKLRERLKVMNKFTGEAETMKTSGDESDVALKEGAKMVVGDDVMRIEDQLLELKNIARGTAEANEYLDTLRQELIY